jgi:hypothetical protein
MAIVDRSIADQVRDGREPQDRHGARPPSIMLRADEVIEE